MESTKGADMKVKVVVDTESGEREVLGEFSHVEEDAVAYWTWEDGSLTWAPADCVEIADGLISYRGPGGLAEVAS